LLNSPNIAGSRTDLPVDSGLTRDGRACRAVVVTSRVLIDDSQSRPALGLRKQVHDKTENMGQ
jgi:hypothetical protein